MDKEFWYKLRGEVGKKIKILKDYDYVKAIRTFFKRESSQMLGIVSLALLVAGVSFISDRKSVV